MDDLELGPVTLILGRNNAGKSSLLRALMLVQSGNPLRQEDCRFGTTEGVTLRLRYPTLDVLTNRIEHYPGTGAPALPDGPLTHQITYSPGAGHRAQLRNDKYGQEDNSNTLSMFPPTIPSNLFIPIFSRRKERDYDSVVNRNSALSVQISDRALTSRIDALNNDTPAGRQFVEIVRRVLGITIGTFVTEDGKQPGYIIDSFNGFPLDRLGEGVSGALALLSSLAFTESQFVYLVEEPENDLHPAALIELLSVIRESVALGNQFIISTHSDIVLRHLGSVEGARVVSASSYLDAGVPTTTFQKVSDAFDRREVLADLGYDVIDPLGWLVLEESTAEQVINSLLIPWFAPRLAAFRTVSARGASKVPATFEDLLRTVVFLHLDPRQNMKPIWVMVDGDKAGADAIERLKEKFPAWADDRFVQLAEARFEAYYPPQFASQVEAAFASEDRRKRMEAKGQLARHVVRWGLDNEDEAKQKFGESALPVIQLLTKLQSELANLPT